MSGTIATAALALLGPFRSRARVVVVYDHRFIDMGTNRAGVGLAVGIYAGPVTEKGMRLRRHSSHRPSAVNKTFYVIVWHPAVAVTTELPLLTHFVAIAAEEPG
jgi:hypothetical protein